MGWKEIRERENFLDSHLKRRKGNPNKIKSHHILHEYVSSFWGLDPWVWWTNDEMGYFRAPKTRNEQRQNVGHIDEYGEDMVRGKRRGYNLPDSYSDRDISQRRSFRSWKTNSKRRKQWKESPEAVGC